MPKTSTRHGGDGVARAARSRPQTQTIGIVGGVGPRTHIELEGELLRAVRRRGLPGRDQDHPNWVLCSATQTVPRTSAVLDDAAKLIAQMVAAIDQLAAAGADFAIIACLTAHAHLDAIASRSTLPILSMVDATIRAAERAVGPRGRVGLLAGTGTVRTQVFQRAATDHAPTLQILTPEDLPGGRKLQRDVMRVIFGDHEGRGHLNAGLKAGEHLAPKGAARLRRDLAHVGHALVRAGANSLVLGCTELPLLGGIDTQACVLNPLQATADEAIALALSPSD